ncbi:APC family permease [Microbacterium allomyrinae]|uniref:APC family permease n=1 Tax=Microbacterium allomyrinae TaxID=2830666 RepID=UPI001E3784EC|nr:APC family permease [Microbacterium allomyrinae]
MTTPSLPRRLGLADAVFIGLGSMIGAGVFVVWAPAAEVAGAGLLIGLALAAVVAFGNATSSAQLAAAHPTSGGTYAYGRAELGAWWGFVAGWGFVIGKTASCAVMALAFAAYAAPPGWERPVAIAAVIALTAVNAFGVTRTAIVARVIVVVALLALTVAVSAAFTGADAQGWAEADSLWSAGGYGILQSAGLLFFAFAGYARIATMGEEVRDPARVIPRAIIIAFAIALTVYAVVAVAVLSALGADGVAASSDAVADAAATSGWAWVQPIVRLGAATGSLGALLALIAGVSRTMFAMAREQDLPRRLAVIQPRWQVPRRAEFVVGGLVVVLVAVTDLRGAIGFSSFGVLLYYFIANVAALRQRTPSRRYPRALQVVGAVGCLVLALALPWQSVVAGAAVVVIGVVYRALRLRLASR